MVLELSLLALFVFGYFLVIWAVTEFASGERESEEIFFEGKLGDFIICDLYKANWLSFDDNEEIPEYKCDLFWGLFWGIPWSIILAFGCLGLGIIGFIFLGAGFCTKKILGKKIGLLVRWARNLKRERCTKLQYP